MKATDDQLHSWRGSGKTYQVIAAEIATWAASKERGTALPSNDEFGRDLRVVVGPDTYRRARRFLVAQGRADQRRLSDGRVSCGRQRDADRHGRGSSEGTSDQDFAAWQPALWLPPCRKPRTTNQPVKQDEV
jgi:hypothetical protein